MKIYKKKDEHLKLLESAYKKHYNLLYNYGLKFINDSELIQDFIQGIFIKLCKKENLEDISALKIYLLRAMRNSIYEYYANQHSMLNIEDIEFSILIDDESFQSFFNKDDTEINQYHKMIKAIKALPPQQKQILYLFYIKDLSHKEISQILDITPQSSMNALSKSIHKLREELTDNSRED